MQRTILICTFLLRCFARLQRETSRNFLSTRFIEEIYMSYMSGLLTFFSLQRVFSSVAASISHFLSNKKWLLIFLCESPLLFFSLSLICWPVAYFLFFSVFLFLYIPNLWDDN